MHLRPFAPLVTLAGEALFVLPWIWLPMMAVFVGRAAARSRRVAALAAVLSGRTADRRVRRRLRLVKPARAVPLGGAWLSDALTEDELALMRRHAIAG